MKVIRPASLARSVVGTCLLLIAALFAPAGGPAYAAGVVGNGTLASCTEAAFDTALTGGGAVSFNCGGPATIDITFYKQIASDTTIDGGGVITLSAHNAAFFQVFFGKSLALANITLANGVGTAGFGAIENFGTLTISNSTLANNHSSTGAGAVFNHGTLTVTNSSLLNNSAATDGGAIDNDGTNLVLTRVLLSGNTAGHNGGAIYSTANALLTNVTLTGNHAANGGGGMFQGAGIALLDFVTVAHNTGLFGAGVYEEGSSAGQLFMQDVLLSANLIGNCDGTVSSNGDNLSSDTNCAALTQPGDRQNVALPLGPLANNGGPTMTLMLPPGSLAIDAGQCLGGVTTDQRGVVRPQGVTCDIGAVERRAGDRSPVAYLPLLLR
jgi:predicted outer membrane repeat protein